MRLIIKIILVITFFSNCVPRKNIPQKKIEAVHFVFADPYVTNEGSVKLGVDSLRMYKIQDWRIVIAPGLWLVNDMDISIRSVMYYNYFIYNTGDDFGYAYDSSTALSNKKIQADSFIIKHSWYNTQLFSGKESLVSKVDSGGTIIEKYIFRTKPNRTFCDTAYYYFGPAYNHLFYSFSDSLDKARGMKLYKYRFYYKADDPFKVEDPWPEKDFFWELKEAKVENEQELLNFIERHKKWLQTQGAK